MTSFLKVLGKLCLIIIWDNLCEKLTNRKNIKLEWELLKSLQVLIIPVSYLVIICAKNWPKGKSGKTSSQFKHC